MKAPAAVPLFAFRVVPVTTADLLEAELNKAGGQGFGLAGIVPSREGFAPMVILHQQQGMVAIEAEIPEQSAVRPVGLVPASAGPGNGTPPDPRKGFRGY